MVKINLYDPFGDFITTIDSKTEDIKTEDTVGVLNIPNIMLSIDPSGISSDIDKKREILKKIMDFIKEYNEINLSVIDLKEKDIDKGYHYKLYTIISPELKK